MKEDATLIMISAILAIKKIDKYEKKTNIEWVLLLNMSLGSTTVIWIRKKIKIIWSWWCFDKLVNPRQEKKYLPLDKE